ncbi:unnamed protein product [Gongylonema pulchrum]|uniref:Dynein light chain n=1 Tax=Gongylonema pulchrum TaxID=637853 RepID=A0A183D762_9BILA|nr:unnamed protein product [Gongylonema pulchrum]
MDMDHMAADLDRMVEVALDHSVALDHMVGLVCTVVDLDHLDLVVRSVCFAKGWCNEQYQLQFVGCPSKK